jgi:hypothetical protein
LWAAGVPRAPPGGGGGGGGGGSTNSLGGKGVGVNILEDARRCSVLYIRHYFVLCSLSWRVQDKFAEAEILVILCKRI